jgi:hypothetical protein
VRVAVFLCLSFDRENCRGCGKMLAKTHQLPKIFCQFAIDKEYIFNVGKELWQTIILTGPTYRLATCLQTLTCDAHSAMAHGVRLNRPLLKQLIFTLQQPVCITARNVLKDCSKSPGQGICCRTGCDARGGYQARAVNALIPCL